MSAAIFGVGLYAYQRWNLVSTGRGLLIIATLLVPLNLVAMAALSKERWSPAMAAVEALSLAIFAWLVGLAAAAHQAIDDGELADLLQRLRLFVAHATSSGGCRPVN